MNILVLFKLTEKWSETWFKADQSLGCNSDKHIAIVQAHFAYMHELDGLNKLSSGGPILKDAEESEHKYVDGAMFIYKNSSVEETRNYAENDPFVKEGVMEIDFIKQFAPGI